MAFTFQPQHIPEVVLVRTEGYADPRGCFLETYKQSAFQANGLSIRFVQDNLSHSTRGVLRGLHYQKHPHAQAKLVIPIHGEIFDVAVDLRHGSPTYGRWVGTNLSADRFEMLYVPIGFAHGFCVLSEKVSVLYKVTSEYAPECDRGIRWNDPVLNIHWPIPHPILSPKDATLPFLQDADNHFQFPSA